VGDDEAVGRVTSALPLPRLILVSYVARVVHVTTLWILLTAAF
jgi:hypothetical protein